MIFGQFLVSNRVSRFKNQYRKKDIKQQFWRQIQCIEKIKNRKLRYRNQRQSSYKQQYRIRKCIFFGYNMYDTRYNKQKQHSNKSLHSRKNIQLKNNRGKYIPLLPTYKSKNHKIHTKHLTISYKKQNPRSKLTIQTKTTQFCWQIKKNKYSAGAFTSYIR